MRTTFSLSYYCRASKADRNGLAPIELGITINGTRKFINLPCKCSPVEFGYKRKPKHIQDYIDANRVLVTNIMTDMARVREPLTTEALRRYLRTGGVVSYTIKDLFCDYMKLIEKRVNADDLTMRAYNKYKVLEKLFAGHIDFQREVTAITPSVVQEFYVYLKGKYQDSTSCGMMTKLKSVIKYAIDNGKLSINPFQGIKITKGKGKIIYLTEPQMKRIIDCEIENESLSNIRDAFVLQASTGLSYCDILDLRDDDIKVTEDGTYYISKQRNKTGTTYTSVILPAGVAVLKRHGGHIPRIISNQKYNTLLKAIQTLTGITTTLTTHVARRTYATTLFNRGVKLEIVSKALGHSKTTITQSAYAELLNKTVIDEISKIM